MSRGWAKASACRLQTTLYCAFLAISCLSGICLGHLSTAWLVSLVVFSCIQVVTREVHRSSLRRLICPAQVHFIFLTVLIISMTFFPSLTQTYVGLSIFVCDVEHLLLNCKAGAPRTEHYQLVRALSAGAVVTVL